jgi:predicted DNA-binding transcriptional regulator AlpA
VSTAALRRAPFGRRVSTMITHVERLELLRFSDLKRLGVVRDRATLRRWLKAKTDPFPSAIVLSGNSIAWRAAEVSAWLDRRPRGAAPQPRHLEAERRAQDCGGRVEVA